MTKQSGGSVRLHLTPEQQREIQRATGKYLTILELSLEEFEQQARPPKGRAPPRPGKADPGKNK
jgi:hypothetical protein